MSISPSSWAVSLSSNSRWFRLQVCYTCWLLIWVCISTYGRSLRPSSKEWSSSSKIGCSSLSTNSFTCLIKKCQKIKDQKCRFFKWKKILLCCLFALFEYYMNTKSLNPPWLEGLCEITAQLLRDPTEHFPWIDRGLLCLSSRWRK